MLGVATNGSMKMSYLVGIVVVVVVEGSVGYNCDSVMDY